MDVSQFHTFLLANFAFTLTLWLWSRAESRAESRNFDTKIDVMQKHSESMIEAIRQDIKDFHGRLCAIEERRNMEK